MRSLRLAYAHNAGRNSRYTAGLKNTAEAKRVVFDGPSRTVIDGPFAETRELVAGFSIWEVKDMDEALAWAKRCPNPMPGQSEIEIRPFYEAADLAEFVTPEELAAAASAENSASPDRVGRGRKACLSPLRLGRFCCGNDARRQFPTHGTAPRIA